MLGRGSRARKGISGGGQPSSGRRQKKAHSLQGRCFRKPKGRQSGSGHGNSHAASFPAWVCGWLEQAKQSTNRPAFFLSFFLSFFAGSVSFCTREHSSCPGGRRQIPHSVTPTPWDYQWSNASPRCSSQGNAERKGTESEGGSTRGLLC